MNENINKIHEELVEYILYLRDRNPKKDWGHIRGWTTIFSYSRWNREFSDLEKYNAYLLKEFESDDKFILMIREWYFGQYERKYLEKYNDKFNSNYLFNFLFGISKNETFEYDYYFSFSESIDEIGYKYLLKSYKENSDYLFVNIALSSYCFHNKDLNLAYKFYTKALSIDKNNPWVLAKFAILNMVIGGFNNQIKAKKIMEKVILLLKDSPWVYVWYGETLNSIGEYKKALDNFSKYEKLTKGKHRTFESFMRKAESYICLGDFKKARIELNKEKQYYFGEGYRYVYNELDKKLTSYGY